MLINLKCIICGHESCQDGAQLYELHLVECAGCGRKLPVVFTPEVIRKLIEDLNNKETSDSH